MTAKATAGPHSTTASSSAGGDRRSCRKKQAMKSAVAILGVSFAVILLLAGNPCQAMSCGEPTEGCPPATAEKNVTLYFYNYEVGERCYAVQTSGCDGYGWEAWFQCWANCRHL